MTPPADTTVDTGIHIPPADAASGCCGAPAKVAPATVAPANVASATVAPANVAPATVAPANGPPVAAHRAWVQLRAAASRVARTDRVWLLVLVLVALMAVLDPAGFGGMIAFALAALASTAPYILVAVLAIGFLKATGAERIVATAFQQGGERRMIVVAALVGGLAPFCSCEVIPFIAGLLAVGTPLSAVMALWLASPLMDPSIFVITAGALGLPFAVAKTVAAVGIGLTGGFAIRWALRAGLFADPLRARTGGGCCSKRRAFEGRPVWRFWQVEERRSVFRGEVAANGLFLLKWLTLAYLIEAVMLAHVPAEAIASVVGGEGLLPIVLGAVVGAPAYLNGYAAPAVVDALMQHGMAPGAAMSFMLAGGITSVPAMAAVFALVKRDVFAAYLGLGVGSAIVAGALYAAAVPYLV
ncbi:MAG: permease [Pseudomonadota bacterium]